MKFKLKSVYINLVNTELTEIIILNVIKFLKQSFNFWTYYYTTVSVYLSFRDFITLIYINSEYLTILINRVFLLKHLLNMNIERSEALFTVYNIKNQLHNISEFVYLNLYINS